MLFIVIFSVLAILEILLIIKIFFVGMDDIEAFAFDMSFIFNTICLIIIGLLTFCS